MHDGCDKSYTTKASLAGHAYVHREPKHRCQQVGCSRAFHKRSALVRHESSHGRARKPRPAKPCDVCGKMFVLAGALVTHAETHATAAEKRRSCSSEGCPMAFYSAEALRRHELKHTSKPLRPRHRKSYPCPQGDCGAVFRFPSQLKAHVTIHTGLKQFQCDVCSKWLRSKATLREHRATHLHCWLRCVLVAPDGGRCAVYCRGPIALDCHRRSGTCSSSKQRLRYGRERTEIDAPPGWSP